MNMEKYASSRKNRRKKIRVILEYTLMAAVAAAIAAAVAMSAHFEPYELTDKSASSVAALYYPGVDKLGSEELMSAARLTEHLAGLKENGYLTLTQEQLTQCGGALPEKGLLLAFEDNRKDTVVFAERSMDDFNYVATLLPGKEEQTGHRKYLTATDRAQVDEDSFWEVGFDDRIEEANLLPIYPRPGWYANHLLMKLKQITGQEVVFVDGGQGKEADWELLRGAAECRDESIILTSEPDADGLIRLKETAAEHLSLSVVLRGNAIGEQNVYLRADERLERYLVLRYINEQLYVYEKGGRAENNQEKLLFYHDFAKDEGRRLEPSDENLDVRGDRQLTFTLTGDTFTVSSDGKQLVKSVKVSVSGEGGIYLQSQWGGCTYPVAGITDTIYDGVFERLCIKRLDASGESAGMLYDNQYYGWDLVKWYGKKLWEVTANWFIQSL